MQSYNHYKKKIVDFQTEFWKNGNKLDLKIIKIGTTILDEHDRWVCKEPYSWSQKRFLNVFNFVLKDL